MLAVGMLVPLLPKLYASLNASGSRIGLLGSAYGFSNLLGGPSFGFLSDAIGARRSLILAMLGSAVGYALVAAAGSLWITAVGRAITGLFKQTLTIAKAALAVISPPGDRARDMGRINSAASAGFIVGPLAGGFLFDGPGGVRAVAGITSLLFVVNAIVAWAFLAQADQSGSVRETKKEDRDSGMLR